MVYRMQLTYDEIIDILVKNKLVQRVLAIL